MKGYSELTKGLVTSATLALLLTMIIVLAVSCSADYDEPEKPMDYRYEVVEYDLPHAYCYVYYKSLVCLQKEKGEK